MEAGTEGGEEEEEAHPVAEHSGSRLAAGRLDWGGGAKGFGLGGIDAQKRSGDPFC